MTEPVREIATSFSYSLRRIQNFHVKKIKIRLKFKSGVVHILRTESVQVLRTEPVLYIVFIIWDGFCPQKLYGVRPRSVDETRPEFGDEFLKFAMQI